MKKIFSIQEDISSSTTLNFKWQNVHSNYIATYGSQPFVTIYTRHGEIKTRIDLEGSCTGCAWDKDGDTLACIDDKQPRVILWDAHQESVSSVETGLRDPICFLLWSKISLQLALGTVKGNLIMYNHSLGRRGDPVMGKHSKAIVSGAWSDQNYLALSSQDKTITVSNIEGETIKQIAMRNVATQLQFGTMKETERSAMGENCISCLVDSKSLFLLKVTDLDHPFELNFRQRYKNIVTYDWFGDGYIQIGFSSGHFICISTHLEEIGQEISQNRDLKDMLSCFTVNASLAKCATAGGNIVRVYELDNVREVTAIITLEEEHAITSINWTSDGQLLSVATPSGRIHTFLVKLPMLGAFCSMTQHVAFLSSLQTVTLLDLSANVEGGGPPGSARLGGAAASSTRELQIDVEIEPNLIALGPNHLAVAMNNQAWFYEFTLDTHSHMPVLTSQTTLRQQEYLKNIEQLSLNHMWAAVVINDKLLLHLIDETQNDGRMVEKTKFPEGVHAKELITCSALTRNFLIFSTNFGFLNIFNLEDWNYVAEHKHATTLVKFQPNLDGNKIFLLDDQLTAFIYNPITDAKIELPNLNLPIRQILWNTAEDNPDSCFLVCGDDRVLTMMHHEAYIDLAGNTAATSASVATSGNDSAISIQKDGPLSSSNSSSSKVVLVGATKQPHGFAPLLLQSGGQIWMLNQSGRLVSMWLGTHRYVQQLDMLNGAVNAGAHAAATASIVSARKRLQATLDQNQVDTSNIANMRALIEQAISCADLKAAICFAEHIYRSHPAYQAIWERLARAAIQLLRIDVAIEIYRRIPLPGMVWALSKISHLEDRNQLLGHACLHLGCFDKAQNFFLSSSDPLTALDMRQDLMHWDAALQLARTLEPARIPLISRQYAQQLEFVGDYVNAMLHYERGLSGANQLDQIDQLYELAGNAEHMFEADDDEQFDSIREEHERACNSGIARVAIRLGDFPRGLSMARNSGNRNLMRECAIILEQMKQLNEAAMMFELAGGQLDRACQLYMRLKNWDKAGELLRSLGAHNATRLQVEYGRAREAEGSLTEAIEAFERGADWEAVVRLKLDPRVNRVEEAARTARDHQNAKAARLVAEYFIGRDQFDRAIRFLVISGAGSAANNEELFMLAKRHRRVAELGDVLADMMDEQEQQELQEQREKQEKQDQKENKDQGAPQNVRATNVLIRPEQFLSIALHLEQQYADHLRSGRFYLKAGQLEKGVRQLLKVPYMEKETEQDNPALNLIVEAVGTAGRALSTQTLSSAVSSREGSAGGPGTGVKAITQLVIRYLMGELEDGVVKPPKYMFRLYMKLGRYRDAAKTAVIIAREEQNAGNYRRAHDVLFEMIRELRAQRIQIGSEMTHSLMLIHSYLLGKLYVKRQNHSTAAKLLVRVAENISKFPTHVVPILTSTVIESHRAGLHAASFSYAAMLLRPEYREQIDLKYRKKIENIIRKHEPKSSSQSEADAAQDSRTICPLCPAANQLVPEFELYCGQCKSHLPYCIASGKHVTRDDLTKCPKCEFPAIYSEFSNLAEGNQITCPMCYEVFPQNYLKRILDFDNYLKSHTQSGVDANSGAEKNTK